MTKSFIFAAYPKIKLYSLLMTDITGSFFALSEIAFLNLANINGIGFWI